MPECSSGVINWTWKSPLKFLAIWNCRNACFQLKMNNITLKCLLLLLWIFSEPQIMQSSKSPFVFPPLCWARWFHCCKLVVLSACGIRSFCLCGCCERRKELLSFQAPFLDTPVVLALCVRRDPKRRHWVKWARRGGGLEQSHWDTFS